MLQTRSMKKTVSLVFLLSLLAATFVSAQNSVKNADAASASAEHQRLLKAYLDVFNAGDVEGLKKFAAEHLSTQEGRGMQPERVAQNLMRFRDMIGGGFDLYKVEKSTDTEQVAVLKSHGEFPMFVRQVWKFDTTNPTLINEREIAPIETPAGALPPKLPAMELAQEIDAKLTRLAAEDKFSGAILIAKDGKPLWQKAYGSADREGKMPNNLDTRFRLGSMNKMFTSVAIAQLVQAGRLKYTDTIARVLPDYPNREVAQKVTVHQLLTHTSGLGDIFGPEFDQKKDSLHEIKDYLQLFAHQPLQFEPGTSWSYSNAGFIVLGLMIEKASGQNYYDYVQRHIYDVAGMKASGSFPKTDKVPNLAVGYTRQGPDASLVPNWDTLPWRGMSAGGGDSTLGDLLRFDQALRSHKLLNAELTDTIMTGKVQPGQTALGRYAYGFEDHQIAGHRIVGHGGGAPGMNSQLDMYLDDGYTVVVLANLDPPAAQRVASYIRERLQ